MTSTCVYLASGKVRSQGFEAEMTGRLGANLDVIASYTFNTNKYVRDASQEGQSFASFAPRHLLRTWMNYTLPWQQRRLRAGLGLSVQSDYRVESRGVTLRQGGYLLAHARLAYDITPRVTAAINIDNLFDRRYYQSLSGTAWNNRYGEPRSVMLTLRAEY